MKLKQTLFLIPILIFFSCGEEKIIQLPETDNSSITKITDVSAAYLFYDETKKDSIELNRKNIIGTTNWLVNVDKRLTLKQAIPSIVFLQNKKRNAEVHKNENAKNYFTCSNPNIQNLAFIEFTDVVYHMESFEKYFSNTENQIKDKPDQIVGIIVHSLDSITINFFTKGCSLIQTSNKNNLIKDLIGDFINVGEIIILIEFNQNLTFQDYIAYKSLLLKLNLPNVTISNDEFIY